MMEKIILLILLLTVLCKGFSANNLKLKQVLILSRHNIKYPHKLQRYSSKPWRPHAGQQGLLTPRGAQLEGYMGEYFSEWFKKEHFLPEECPDEGTVYVYANSKPRTKATARAFVDSAFKGCNMTVHSNDSIEPDPFFEFVIFNTTEAYKEKVLKEVNRKLRNNSKLMAVYSELNNILGIEDSQVCKQDGLCDLTEANDTVSYKIGKTVRIFGPFQIAHKVVTEFIMSYYEGMPIQDVAWGQITTPEKWNLITEMSRQNTDIRYSVTADDVSAPLVKYLTQMFKDYDKMPKLMVLFGHDTNMISVAYAMGFQSIHLLNQFEKYPIGGKFVFQRWTDSENEYLKVEYVYPSWSQLRNGSKYSLENPPQRVVMRLNWCDTNELGFCPWNDFVNKL